MVKKEEEYKMILYTDLVCFLLDGLLIDKPNKKELAEKVLQNWISRNEKYIIESFESQVTSIISKDKTLINQKDEISILLSVHNLVFNSIRKDFIEELTKEISKRFEFYEKKTSEE